MLRYHKNMKLQQIENIFTVLISNKPIKTSLKPKLKLEQSTTKALHIIEQKNMIASYFLDHLLIQRFLYLKYKLISMAFKAVFGFLDAFLGIAGLGLSITSFVMEQKLKGYFDSMKELVDSNQDILQSSTTFNEKMQLMTSSVLQIQFDKTNTMLISNIEEIQKYYKQLADIMKNVDQTKFHDLSTSVPGISNSFLPQLISKGFFAISVLTTIKSTKQAFKYYKQYKDQKRKKGNIENTNADADAENGSKIFDNKKSKTNASVDTVFEPAKMMSKATPLQKIKIKESLRGIKGNSVKKNFATKIMQKQRSIFKRLSPVFSKIGVAAGFLVSAASVGLSIYGIIKLDKSIDNAKEQLEKMKVQMQQFIEACLDILFNIKAFMNGFQAQILSYVSFLKYVKLICTHNSIAYVNDGQTAQQYNDYISQINLDELNLDIIGSIEGSINLLQTHVKTVNIKQQPILVNGKQGKKYSTTSSHEDVSQAFKKVTQVISILDEKVDIEKTYNLIYQKLKIAQNILKEVNFEGPMKTVQFIGQMQTLYQLQQSKWINPLGFISSSYATLMNPSLINPLKPDPNQYPQKDKQKIAMYISLYTKKFPVKSQETKVFGFQLKDFEYELSDLAPVSKITEIQDIDIGQLMGAWPNDKMQQSFNQIANKYKVIKTQLTYQGSSLYVQNLGTASDQDYQLYRVQFFDRKKETKQQRARYYVLYESVADTFQDVRQNSLSSEILK